MLSKNRRIAELERRVAALEERDREKSKIIEEILHDLGQQKEFLFMLKYKIGQIRQIEEEPIYMDTE